MTIFILKSFLYFLFWIFHILFIKCIIRTFPIKIYCIMICTKSFCPSFGTSRSRTFPTNFVNKVFFSKNLVHQHLNIMPNMPVEVYIDAGSVTHNATDGDKVFVHPVQVFFLIPDITIHFFLQSICGILIVWDTLLMRGNFLRGFWITPQINLLSVVSTTRKWWINVDKIYLSPLFLKIGASRKTSAAQQ